MHSLFVRPSYRSLDFPTSDLPGVPAGSFLRTLIAHGTEKGTPLEDSLKSGHVNFIRQELPRDKDRERERRT